MMDWGLYNGETLVSSHNTYIEALNAAVFAHQEFSVEHEVKLIDETNAAYKKQAKSQIGETLNDHFCNGFFGSRNFDLAGAKITRVYESDDDDAIVVEIQYENGKYDYGHFQEGFRDWKSVAEYLEEWINYEE